MFNKYIKTSILSCVFILQACSSPLSVQNTKKPTGPSGDQITTSPTAHEETITLPDTTMSIVEKSLQHRMVEIQELVPSADDNDNEILLGLDLQHNEASSNHLSMEDAVFLAIENNLDIHISSIAPQISAQSVVAAEAAFDMVLGAGVSKNRSRVPQQQAVTQSGQLLSSSERATDIFSSNASLTKKLDSGGTFLLSTDITKTMAESKDFDYSPDPAWQTVGTVELSHPLLRNFGETVTLSTIKLSEIDKDKTEEEFRKTLNEVVASTEQGYLDLCLQWRLLQIKQWLLSQGEEVVTTLERRMSYDTSEADYAQAVATVQRRRADVIEQQSTVQSSSDVLKQLINSNQHSLNSESVIQPSYMVQAFPVSVSLRQALVTAVENRPDILALALEIKSSEINIKVAQNAQLPELDMQAQMSFYGLGDTVGNGYDEVFNGDYVNYLAGLTLSIPLGNRAADSNEKIMRLKQMSAIASYKKGILQATLEIKNALRDLLTNAALMRANRDYRIAQTENLRALLVEEETMAGLTPTFLNLKLQTQSGLASARSSEISSVINYNKSISNLYKAMGTTLSRHQVSIERDPNTD